MRAFAFLLLVACSPTEPIPIAGAPAAPPPSACLPNATITVSDVVETRTGGTIAHVKLEGIDDYAGVIFPALGKERAARPAVLPPVTSAFSRATLDPSPQPSATARGGSGFFSAIGNLMKGAIVGLTNLVLLPVNLPLSIIDSRHALFPFSWSSGAVRDAYPSAPTHPFFEDNVLDETAYATKKADYDMRLASATMKTAEIDRREREMEWTGPRFPRDHVYESDVKLRGDATKLEVRFRGCDRVMTALVPSREPYPLLDDSAGASQSANVWYENFGTRSPQLVAAASAEDAFKLAATTEETKLEDTTVACRVSTKRPDAKQKKATLTARFSFGDLMAVGASVQARAAGEPMTFVIPNVSLAQQGHVKLAVVDSAAEWGGAALTTFTGKPLLFTHERFEAECRTLGPAQTKDLAERSLERLRALPELPDSAFDHDPKNPVRVAARLTLFDSVRDIEALVGRQSETAKAAQSFADERIKGWATRVQAAMTALIERAQPSIVLGDVTLAITGADPRIQACTVHGELSVKKKTRVSFRQLLMKLKFLDKNGNSVEPFFLDADDIMPVTPDKPLTVKFDIPAVNKADVCAVALAKGDSPPLIIKAAH